MDAETLTLFLEAHRYAVLATSRGDGRPHAAPIGFVVWAGAFWIASVEGVRLRNLRVRPYAAMVIMEGEGETHRAVITEGRIKVLEGPAQEIMPEALRPLWLQRWGALPDWASALIALHPKRFFSYDASKGKGTDTKNLT